MMDFATGHDFSRAEKRLISNGALAQQKIRSCRTAVKNMTEANTTNIPPDKLVRVTFEPEGKTVEFEFGTMPYDHHGKPMSFLDVAENFNIFLDHACGGSCACTTCHVWVKEGASGISEADDDELDRLDMAADQQLNSRLGCQAIITKPGNYVVEIPKWNRNYVSEGKPLALADNK